MGQNDNDKMQLIINFELLFVFYIYYLKTNNILFGLLLL